MSVLYIYILSFTLISSSCSKATKDQIEYAPRICVVGEGIEARLELTRNPGNPGAHFQFGSILAWENDGVNYEIKFNPSELPADTLRNDWEVGRSCPDHTVENVRLGRGDPCKLVGFTVSQIKAAIAGKADTSPAPENGLWRMPSREDNSSFAANYSSEAVIEGIKGRYFFQRLGSSESRKHFIPYSPETGIGRYWSCTSYSYGGGYSLYFGDSYVNPETSSYQASAYNVRCVPC
ncbi:MAG: hypothetical protein ACRCZQ_09055 [Bacteroidales bacterium]